MSRRKARGLSCRVGSLQSESVEADPQITPPTVSADCVNGRCGRKVFLFVNPLSGGSAAEGFCKAGLQFAEVSVSESEYAQVWIWDIREGLKGDKPGFHKLKQVLEDPLMTRPDEQIIVVVAGGDGTVMWCASEIWAHNVPSDRLIIGVVPYGTGNDFARVFSWHKLGLVVPFKRRFKSFRKLLKIWLNASSKQHDIWEVTITLHDDGVFQKIDNRTRKKVTLYDDEEHQAPSRVKSFKLLNYFSIGVDARIGIGFDRNRSTHPIFNKIRYGLEGAKKVLFTKTALVSDLVKEISCGRQLVCATEPSSVCVSGTPRGDAPILLPCASLVFSNIPSFAAGLDLWKKSSGRSGISRFDSAIESEYPVLVAPQVVGDRQMELMSVGHAIDFAIERAFHGRARRLAQGKGPFSVTFHEELHSDTRCYFQVDGEFFQINRPKTIVISWHTTLNVLAYEPLTKAES